MDESVSTHVKKCVWLVIGTLNVTILLISHAAVTMCRVCRLKLSPLSMARCGAHAVTSRAGEESSCERGWCRMMEHLYHITCMSEVSADTLYLCNTAGSGRRETGSGGAAGFGCVM